MTNNPIPTGVPVTPPVKEKELLEVKYSGPFSRVFREGGSPAPGHAAQWEKELDKLEPFEE